MAKNYVITTFLLIAVSSVDLSSAQTCTNHTFSSDRVFESCTDLPVLRAHIHWHRIPSSKTFRVAYRAAQSSAGWIAWGINPTGTRMIGTQALVAFHDSDGIITAYTTPITGYNPSMLPGELSIGVANVSAEYFNHEMTIFAVVGPLKDGNNVNHVWQAGSSVSDGVPQIHETSGENMESTGTLNLLVSA